MSNQIKTARAQVNALQFGTPEWEAAMQVVRSLVEAQRLAAPAEEFCSVDSGFHRTRYMDGSLR